MREFFASPPSVRRRAATVLGGGGIDGWRFRSAAVRARSYYNLPKHIPETFNNSAERALAANVKQIKNDNAENLPSRATRTGRTQSRGRGKRGGKIIRIYIWKTTFTSHTPTRHSAASCICIARGAVMREDEPRESNNIRELNERFFLFSVHTPRHRGSHFFMMYTNGASCSGRIRVCGVS